MLINKTMEIKVFIIIVTYNAMKWLDKCLQSIDCSSIKTNVVIIDNASTDETVKHIRNNYPKVHLIANEKNRGFGQANNQGIEFAYKNRATNFFLLNQDAYIHEDTVEKLVAVQNENDIALVSPIHLNGRGESLDYNFYRKTIINEDNIEFVSDAILGKEKDYYSVFKINAAAWMLSRRCVEKIGGFDPIYFHYGEDGNYCQRLKYHNEQCVFVPCAYIQHDRIRQGNMTVYKKNHTIMQLLYAYTDVNYSPWRVRLSKLTMHGSHFKRSLYALFTFHFKDLGTIVGGYIEFFKKIPFIKHSLTVNRKQGAAWLDLEYKD